ncbi:MAG: tyrosine recombinase XerC, partial [Ruminococcus sp.]|nr:tyrosine recombinase XerC [Ruminococcus sp.]
NYNNDSNPEFLNNYLVHLKVIRMLSERTINEYYFDIRLFLKYIHKNNINTDSETEVEDTDITYMSPDELQKISVTDIYNFIFYVSDERKNDKRARSRKISSLRSFFKYLTKVEHIVEYDPTREIDMPSPKMTLPKFLSLNESMRLLETSNNSDSKRDYCIITILLNCGIRLSELVSINIKDIDFYENRIKILGKGNKERMIYLNNACIDGLKNYLEIRTKNQKAVDEPALFISNQNKRISKRRVQQIVENTIKNAELDGKGFTTHKLRHTAATLMYQYGGADILTLKELLGHSSISTTEIYTHLNNEQVRNAIENNPLADVNFSKNKSEKNG